MVISDSSLSKDYFKGAEISNYENYILTCHQLYMYFLLILDFLNKQLPRKKSRILDVGCAYGILLKFFDEIGWETYGVDISKYAIDVAKKFTRAKLYNYEWKRVFQCFQKTCLTSSQLLML